ncbi:MAG: hypothetical protein JXB17_08400 [Bacteroidales bacterium]|nr:hypothetical protein [Bacteroidales bacterium]
MGKKVIFTGNWRSDKNVVKVRLPLIIFTENDNQIIYCPALEVSGYGKSEPEARESFETSLDQFLEYTIHKETLSSELKKLGWKLRGKSRPAYPPSMKHLLENNENFSHIFNEHPFRKIDEQFEIPVAQ